MLFHKGDKPPNCPNCNMPPWRPNNLIHKVIEADIEGRDADVTCCMHCLAIWKLEGTKWVEPNKAEMEILEQHFASVRMRFAMNFLSEINRTPGNA